MSLLVKNSDVRVILRNCLDSIQFDLEGGVARMTEHNGLVVGNLLYKLRESVRIEVTEGKSPYATKYVMYIVLSNDTVQIRDNSIPSSKHGSCLRGIFTESCSNKFFVAIDRVGSFEFAINDMELYAEYVAEKLYLNDNMGKSRTVRDTANFLNGIRKFLLQNAIT